MIPRIGPMELVIIVLIVLIIFGAGKLPQVGGAIGKGIREFRRAKEGMDDDSQTDSAKVRSETTEATGASLGARSS